jgi:hypothetical protein
VPSVGRRLGGQRYGALDAIVSIEDLLSQVTLGKSDILNLLRSRMAQLNLVPSSVPNLDYSDDKENVRHEEVDPREFPYTATPMTNPEYTSKLIAYDVSEGDEQVRPFISQGMG